MKAIILAAGEGNRLRPITYHIPKCLVKIKGKPLLSIWFELCNRYKIDEVLINLHHLSEKVEDFLDKYNNGIKISRFYEKKLLGSAGTVLSNRKFLNGEKDFFIFYADNLTNINLKDMLRYHRGHKSILTMALFKTVHPEQCGIVQLNRDNKIIDLEEKPKNPKGDIANAGIFVADRRIFDYIPKKRIPVDFGFDVLPNLIGKMYGYLLSCYLIDIGTPKDLRKAQKDWPGL